MTPSNRRLIPEHIQDAYMRLIAPLIRLFTHWGMNPNTFTVAGVIITSFAAVAFFLQNPRLGGALVLLGGLCDSIDGSLARNSGKASRFGALLDSSVDRYAEFAMLFGIGGYALLDSSVDRYAEFAMLFGIGGYFLLTRDYFSSAGTFLALCGSFMVSYTRARAESLGFAAKVGIMQRPERIVFLGAGALIHPVALTIAIWMVAVFANFTALQRLRFAFKQDSGPAHPHKKEDPKLKSVPVTKGET